jgi:hypothetical protein
MHARQNTGLAPENVRFPQNHDFVNGEAFNLLRPETLESIFYMWRRTKDPMYREWAWDIFTSFHAHCKTPETGGYAGLRNVALLPPERDDVQQTFLFAETFKYLYLIFSDDTLLPLNDWVLNTEAQPFRIRKRDPVDIWVDWEQKLAAERGETLDLATDAPTTTAGSHGEGDGAAEVAQGPFFVPGQRSRRAGDGADSHYEPLSTEELLRRTRWAPATLPGVRQLRESPIWRRMRRGGIVIQRMPGPLHIDDPHLDDD